MAKKAAVARVQANLACAARGRRIATGEAWDYGWSVERYRRTVSAKMTLDHERVVSLTPEAVEAFEEATAELLHDHTIRDLYDLEEFWSVIASLVGTLPLDLQEEHLAAEINRRLARVMAPPTSLVVCPVANVANFDEVVSLGPLVIGHAGAAWQERLSEKLGHVGFTPMPITPWWLPNQAQPTSETPALLLAYSGATQGHRAMSDAEQAFEDLTALALMLETDLDGQSLFSLRGDTNRPGIRGLVVDRASLHGAAKQNVQLQRELGAPTIVDGIFGQSLVHRWFSEDPFPLQKLLAASERRIAVAEILSGSTSIQHRLRTAARWHAKAHWSSDRDDAVLALGVCFDAMLTEKGPSPGRVHAERFALLDTDPKRRKERYRRYQNDYYAARSAVAHGGRKSSVNGASVREMAAEARAVFGNILRLTKSWGVKTDIDYDAMFEDMKWGST